MSDVEAQWFKNGDHPKDYSRTHEGFDAGVWRDFPPEERKSRGWEGDVVRYFRRPDVPGRTACESCGKTMHEHGWLEMGGDGQTVCPGDWVVTDGSRYHVKKDGAK